MNYEQMSKALASLGLNQLDVNVYLTIFTKGKVGVSQLARLLEVERVTIYSALVRLQEYGLLPVERQPYERTVTVEPPSRIYALLEKKRTELFYQTKGLEDALPRLMAEYAAKGHLASFRLFEGREQFLAIFEEAVREAEKKLFYYGDAKSFVDYVGIDYENRWVRKRVAKRIKLQMLVFSDRYVIERYKLVDKKELRETRIIATKSAFQSSFMVYGTKTLLWNPVAERAVVIDDPLLTDMFRYLFTAQWKLAK
jgi:sugar-specific transcriptional regulator TrmB